MSYCVIFYFIGLLLCKDIEDIIVFFVVIDVFYLIVFIDVKMVWVKLYYVNVVVEIYLYIFVLIVILLML